MKVLIVSALPYNLSSSTRAFRTYFHSFGKDDLAQIYTNPCAPDFSFCNNFYQITDKRVFKNHFSRRKDPGLMLDPTCKCVAFRDKQVSKNSVLKKDIGLIHLIRLSIWKEKFWFTQKLIKWVNDFKPDCIFYHNSSSLFISKIAFTISDFFNLPLVVEISDDYYFSKRIPLLFETIYNKKYRNFFRAMLKRADGCFFISEKMKQKYALFNISNSDCIHISGERCVDSNPNIIKTGTFCYFGNTGLNRSKTLIKLAKKLSSINENVSIDIYSPVNGNGGFKNKKQYKGIKQCGFLEYEMLISKIQEYEYIVIAEPLDCKYAKYISLSLSTKIADTMCLGKKIICVGNDLSGTVEYIRDNKCGMVISTAKEINNLSLKQINDFDWSDAVQNCRRMFEKDFSFDKNSNKSLEILEKAIQNRGVQNG